MESRAEGRILVWRLFQLSIKSIIVVWRQEKVEPETEGGSGRMARGLLHRHALARPVPAHLARVS